MVQGNSPGRSAIYLLPYVVSACVASVFVALIVPKARYYNPFFLLGSVLLVLGVGSMTLIDPDFTEKQSAVILITTGIGVGMLVLANVAPCHIDLPEKDHGVANGLAFFSSSLGW